MIQIFLMNQKMKLINFLFSLNNKLNLINNPILKLFNLF